MKKIIVTLLLVSAFLFLVACDEVIEPGFSLEENVSYYETHLYTGESTNFAVKMTRGVQEDTFIADGAVGEMVNFTTLKVTPLHVDLFNQQYCYKLTGADGEITGELSKDMFGVSFSAEIENIESIGVVQSVTITATDIEDVIELNNKLKDMMDWEDVLSIAANEFQGKIDEECDANSFEREIHIKFINNRTDRNSPYYWYVAFINSTSDYWAVLLDPETGDVVSKKS